MNDKSPVEQIKELAPQAKIEMLENGNMIDGGRSYGRSSGSVTYYKVVNGEFVENSSF